MEASVKIEEEGYVWKPVILLEDIGSLKKGRKGLCTADLKEHDAFAVWFEEPVCYSGEGKPIYWVTFRPWTEREKFDILK